MKQSAGAIHHQLTTDGFRVYVDAVEDAFCGKRRDYAVLQKVHGPDPLADDRRYTPPVVLSDRHIEMTNARLSC